MSDFIRATSGARSFEEYLSRGNLSTFEAYEVSYVTIIGPCVAVTPLSPELCPRLVNICCDGCHLTLCDRTVASSPSSSFPLLLPRSSKQLARRIQLHCSLFLSLLLASHQHPYFTAFAHHARRPI
ncbi:hypothetical protein ACN38_g2706 [Penicillium nordicum]|uniref:Uncharacterized protein n=1 Tax=Penicillium nordicum TaxID=229535 RepID=A0A0M8P6X1_9EURO|nr:hypothetical protein ACN38_g2706 [Penicillium nordicum]